jgi:hypothetical protein
MSCCPIVELRQYLLHPGGPDVLVELFDREFLESQEAAGMEIIGQFRDLDRPDRFVWLRGFSDMDRRRRSLETFYTSPVWKANSAAANATMIDVSDVLLLRPLDEWAFAEQPERPAPGEERDRSTIGVTVCSLSAPADAALVARQLVPAVTEASSRPLAVLVEETSENDFPALPVREGEHVVVWVQRTGDDDHRRALDEVAVAALPALVGSPVHLRLDPTPRSRLR